jgi:hypothetical protein
MFKKSAKALLYSLIRKKLKSFRNRGKLRKQKVHSLGTTEPKFLGSAKLQRAASLVLFYTTIVDLGRVW